MPLVDDGKVGELVMRTLVLLSLLSCVLPFLWGNECRQVRQEAFLQQLNKACAEVKDSKEPELALDNSLVCVSGPVKCEQPLFDHDLRICLGTNVLKAERQAQMF